MGAPINGKTICYLCRHTFEYVGELGTIKIIESPNVHAESVIATGTFCGTNGNMVDLEIIVECPKCGTKNKTTNSIKSIS